MRAILTFHSIDDSGSVLSFSVRMLDALLAELTGRAIPVCDLNTLLAEQGKPGVAITFDDGMKSVLQAGLPVLQRYQAPAHVFLLTGAMGSDSAWPRQPAITPAFEMLNWREVEQMHAAGIRIECHTHSHPDMRRLTKNQIAEECGRADEIISSRLGRKPDYFAYPFGRHNRLARDFARKNYLGSFTTELRELGMGEDTAALPRLDSYYFRSRTGIRLIDSAAMRFYLRLRSGLRTLKGSQSRADG